MRIFGNYFGAVLLSATLLFAVTGSAVAVSTEEFTAAIEKIKHYDYPQNREVLSTVSAMVNAVGDQPSERKVFAATMAAMLGSDASDACKVFLCRQLAIIGSEDEVAALSLLLVEEKFSDMARYALERIGGENTLAALRGALTKTTGRIQIGIINSLGVLADQRAVPALVGLAKGGDVSAASAAVAALGKMGGSAAETSLKALSLSAGGKFQDEIYDAHLACADKLTAANQRSQALKIYNTVYSKSSSPDLRAMALRGRVAGAGDGATAVILEVLKGNDLAMQAVAVSLTSEIKGGKTTTAIAQMLPRLSPAVQVKLLVALGYRGDRAALPEVSKAANSADESTQVAALSTLGEIGDASTVPLLAQVAAREEGAPSRSARKSLHRIKGQEVDAQIVTLLKKSDLKVKLELIKTVSARAITSAAPVLLKSATDADAEIRLASLRALGVVADGTSLPALLDLLVTARTEADRTEAESAVVEVARKNNGAPNPSQTVGVRYPSARDSATKVALIKVLGELGSDSSLALLRRALADPDKAIAHAAVSALSAWPNANPIPDLQQCVKTAEDRRTRTLALWGLIRLIGLEENRDAAQTVALYEDAMNSCTEPGQRKAVLAGLGEVRTQASLKIVAAYLGDETSKLEAAVAVSKIVRPQSENAWGLRGADVMVALQKAATLISDASERKKVEDYLSTMPEDEEGFISMFNGKNLDGWQGGDFAVADGLLVCHGHHGGGLAYTKSQVTNFVMRFEVKLSPGANNGLNFRSRNSQWNEIQILDDSHPLCTNLHPYQVHGSLYGVAPAKRGFLKPVGQWNYEEVMADGSHIRVRLNGTVILEAELSKLDLDKCLDGTAHPGLRDASGDLGWLGHLNMEEKPGEISFRNIRIKNLP